MDPIVNPQVPIQSKTPEEQPEEEKFPFLKPLRTYQGDVAQAIQQKNSSVVSMAIAESRRKEQGEKIAAAPVKKVAKNTLLLTISALLIVGGLGVVYYLFIGIPGTTPAEQERQTVPSIINANQSEEITITQNSDILALIKNEMSKTNIPVGQIKNIYFTQVQSDSKIAIDAPQFLGLIGTHAPSAFLRALTGEFMLGFYQSSTLEPFIILKNNSYQNAFAGMLTWENMLAADFAGFIIKTSTTDTAQNINIANGSTTTPENAGISTADLLSSRTFFVDLVIKNKDVRALENDKGQILLLYTFIDKDTIAITRDEITLKAILDGIDKKIYTR